MDTGKCAALVAALLAAGSPALADDWDQLCKDGYGVVDEANLRGEYKGCEHGKRIPLDNGLVFVCQEYNYDYGYSLTSMS